MAPKKGGNRGNATQKPSTTVPDSEYIVFGDEKKPKRGRKGKDVPKEDTPTTSKPTVKQVIGGASWTGKLPVNLLSEHCQRQKWNKPDYDMRQMPARDGSEKVYRSAVTLSKTDPKTRETTTLPSIRLPPEQIQLSEQPSALEARHFAATYALFRVSSMKNIHMTLPPKYKDLWKGEFAQFKKEDVDNGRAWKYDEDPFAAEVKRQEIHRDMEKRKAEQELKQAAQASNANSALPLGNGVDPKGWANAPKAEMGQQIRTDIEQIIRKDTLWNTNDIKLTDSQRRGISAEVTRLGFRKSHVEEALEYCKDQEEVLEWLIIHVPEDDLPRWALPPSYSAGISLVSGDIVKEAKLKNLARAGYSADACTQALRESGGDENEAAHSLQRKLVPQAVSGQDKGADGSQVWDEEVQALEAVFGEAYTATSMRECTIALESSLSKSLQIRFRCPLEGYPATAIPAIAIEAEDIPAYIRLSATKQAVMYAQENLLGEMMIYNIQQWLELALPTIIEDPGPLAELNVKDGSSKRWEPVLSNGKDKGIRTSSRRVRAPQRQQQRRDARNHSEIFDSWSARQSDPVQMRMLQQRQRLPAWSKQQEIVEAINSHQVTIVSGETGSGKSTQVVQFILDDAIKGMRGGSVNIMCTQPRRVATLSLADRVSSERCSIVGQEVGYVIRGEAKVSDKTKITFMTTGVLLRRLQSAVSLRSALEGISHIFIDEVHERSLDTDFLLTLLRDCLKAQKTLRVVLMSATLDAEIFTAYFGGAGKVSTVFIEGRTFPVTDVYLDEVLMLTKFGGLRVDEDIGKTIGALGMGINYDLIRHLVMWINDQLGSQNGSILIFLPGTMEIDRCIRVVESLPKVMALPLHASLLPVEQRRVFPAAPAGQRKVIAATNVAETSITIEDVVAVIDTGRVKETRYDSINNITRLEEVWASQAACKQRRGRAGRVRAGTCYKLFTNNTESKMQSKPLPEIQRVPLEQLCLSVKAVGTERDISTFLSQTLTPPDSRAVANAIKTLHTIGALEDDQLTALGIYLSMVPADLRCAKLLVYGTLFGVLESCLTVASILTVRSPFVSPRDKREEAAEARSSFPVEHGDLLLDMAAYDEWSLKSYQARPREVQDWCSTKFLSQQTLRDVSSTRRQLLDSLKDAGLVPWTYKSPDVGTTPSVISDTNQCLLLRALVAASLQPQIASIRLPSKKYISSMSGAKELDPEAKTIKYFVRDESHNEAVASNPSGVVVTGGGGGNLTISFPSTSQPAIPDHSAPPSHPVVLSMVFIHPSSVLFTSQTFAHHATHLSFFTKVHTSKSFIRDLTPLNVYSLLLFGGRLEVDTSGRGLTVGGTWKVKGWARIGVLVSRLRTILDQELRQAVEEGDEGGSGLVEGSLMGRMGKSQAAAVAKRLIVLNGQDV